MERTWKRRDFSKALGLGLGAACLAQAAPARKLKIGHTGIAWGFTPNSVVAAVKDVGSLGYHGFESFDTILAAWEPKGGIEPMLKGANLPLISAYCNTNLTDPTRRKEAVERMLASARIIKRCGGTTAVIGPNGVKRPSYDFKAAKADIVATLNEICKALADIGITGVLHQHTGTCVEFRDEVYAVMEAVDTRYVKFGPDVGQLLKGGSDPVKVVNDFLPVITHLHLKDYDGGPYWEGYCPLGRGKVDLPAVLDLLEKAPDLKIAMVELDPTPNQPLPPLESAKIAKEYLQKQGYTFRS